MRPESENRDWRAVHVGFENDGLTLDGLDVWTQRWRPAAGAPPVRLAHPAHPTQFHDFGIHEIGEVARPVRFAACELSNGVWGFYVPAGNPVVASVGVRLEGTQITRHESPDHTVRVDLAAVEWSNSHWVESPRVTDLATGRVVLDLWNTDWDATVSFPRDRCVRLGFRRYRHAGALAVEIDLVRESYRVLFPSSDPQALPEAPLAGIAEGLEAASRRAADVVASAPARQGPPLGMSRPRPFAAWRSALLILAGALVVIAAVALWASVHAPASDRKLDKVPAMPR